MRVRKALLALLAVLVAAAGYAVWERATFDRAAWLADYDQLRAHVSRNYANLLWVIDEHGLDPTELHRGTLGKLEEARTDRAARAAIASFISAFQDPHFRIARTPLSRRLETLFVGEADEIAENTPAEKACAALGFSDEDDGLAFGAPALEVRHTPDNAFSSGTFQLANKKVGLLRIPIFDQKGYRGACERAWRAHVGSRQCDQACVEAFIQTTVPNQLLSDLTEQVRSLEKADAELLVVDVTGNGGGTDWVEPAARIVAKTPLACARVSFTKGPHWVKAFSGIAEEIDRDLAAPQNPEDTALLQSARSRALDLAERAGASCALDTLWIGGVRPACSNLVEGTEYTTCGLLDGVPKGSLTGAASADALFKGLGFEYEAGIFPGRVAVLIDGGTASAAEYFAAILADGDAAVIVGQRTLGVGCGYTNGGVGVLLTRSGLKVEMPDCQRLRRDGTNEMAGISPNIAVDWKDGDSDAERWAKLVAALEPLAAE